jgi:hypothetical protein
MADTCCFCAQRCSLKLAGARKGISRKDGSKNRRRIRARYQGEIDGKRSGMTLVRLRPDPVRDTAPHPHERMGGRFPGSLMAITKLPDPNSQPLTQPLRASATASSLSRSE